MLPGIFLEKRKKSKERFSQDCLSPNPKIVTKIYQTVKQKCLTCERGFRTSFNFYDTNDDFSMQDFRLRRKVSSGMLRRVALVRTDVSGEPGAAYAGC
jgi:hypothetical protein